MTDFRTLLEEGCCKPGLGCNVATTCMCALAEDAIEEIEKLRAHCDSMRAIIARQVLKTEQLALKLEQLAALGNDYA